MTSFHIVECVLNCLHVKQTEGCLGLFQRQLDLWISRVQEILNRCNVYTDKCMCVLLVTVALYYCNMDLVQLFNIKKKKLI